MKTKIAKFGFVLLLVGLVFGSDLLFSHSGLMLFGDYCIFIELFGWFAIFLGCIILIIKRHGNIPLICMCILSGAVLIMSLLFLRVTINNRIVEIGSIRRIYYTFDNGRLLSKVQYMSLGEVGRELTQLLLNMMFTEYLLFFVYVYRLWKKSLYDNKIEKFLKHYIVYLMSYFLAKSLFGFYYGGGRIFTLFVIVLTVTSQLYALILYLLLALKILEINVNNKFIEKILNFSGASEKESVNYNIRTDLVICSVILFFIGILWLNENLEEINGSGSRYAYYAGLLYWVFILIGSLLLKPLKSRTVKFVTALSVYNLVVFLVIVFHNYSNIQYLVELRRYRLCAVIPEGYRGIRSTLDFFVTMAYYSRGILFIEILLFMIEYIPKFPYKKAANISLYSYIIFLILHMITACQLTDSMYFGLYEHNVVLWNNIAYQLENIALTITCMGLLLQCKKSNER